VTAQERGDARVANFHDLDEGDVEKYLSQSTVVLDLESRNWHTVPSNIGINMAGKVGSHAPRNLRAICKSL
jgi:hypothetical protein